MFPGSGFDLVIGPSKMSDDSPLPNVSPGRGHMPYGQCTSIRRSRAISIRLSLDRIHNCRCCTTGTSRLSPGQALRQRLWVFFVPARTSGSIVEKIHRDTVTALSDPVVRLKLENIGMVAVGSTPRTCSVA